LRPQILCREIPFSTFGPGLNGSTEIIRSVLPELVPAAPGKIVSIQAQFLTSIVAKAAKVRAQAQDRCFI